MTLLKRAAITAVVGVAFLVIGPVAAADGPYEPNESVTQTFGPLAGGISYNGVIETSNDVDWFHFYIAGQRQFEVVLTWRGGDCYDITATLRDREGGQELSTSVDSSPESTVGRITLTSPGSARYNLEVNGCTGGAYTIQITPADAVTAQPPTRCFNHVHSQIHVHRRRHRHIRRHRHGRRRIHIHRRTHIHRRRHAHRQNHPHCVPAP